jgi:pimeloyl-ACP methyl ester carboxylesterase
MLAIVGTEDVMTPPKYSQFMQERMESTSIKVIEGGTHFVFAEFPNDVNQAIETFLNTLE